MKAFQKKREENVDRGTVFRPLLYLKKSLMDQKFVTIEVDVDGISIVTFNLKVHKDKGICLVLNDCFKFLSQR